MPEELFAHVDRIVRESMHFFPECLLTAVRQSTTGSVVVQISVRNGCRSNRLVLMRAFLEGRLNNAGLAVTDCSILRDCMTLQVKQSNNTPLRGVVHSSS